MEIKKLGVFDSGIGGLSVLQELFKLPIPNFVYFADTKNLPYGEKSPQQIKEFTLNAVRFLVEKEQTNAIVLACHTASAIALEHVQIAFPDISIFGVIDPVVQAAVTATKNQRIGIIGTPATVASGMHKAKILKLNSAFQIFAQAAPKLVPLIEDGKQKTSAMTAAIWEYLAPLQDAGIDTLIIGCTHYELIKDEIRELAGTPVQLVSAPELTLMALKAGLGNSANHPQKCFYHVSGDLQKFILNARKIGIGLEINSPENSGPIVAGHLLEH